MTNTFSSDPATTDTASTTDTVTTTTVVHDENVDLLRKRLRDKDEFIETLKGETKEFRDRIASLESQLQQARTIDELMERVSERHEPSQSSEPTAPRLDEDSLLTKLEERVFGKLSQKQKQELETQNWNVAVAGLQEKYGEKYADFVRARADELAVPIEEMDRLAKTSPKALLELVSGQQQRTTMQPTTPSQRTSQGSQSQEKLNDEYFDKISRLRHVAGPDGEEARRVFKSKDYQAQWRKHILAKTQ